jgi:hypothetical protein
MGSLSTALAIVMLLCLLKICGKIPKTAGGIMPYDEYGGGYPLVKTREKSLKDFKSTGRSADHDDIFFLPF